MQMKVGALQTELMPHRHHWCHTDAARNKRMPCSRLVQREVVRGKTDLNPISYGQMVQQPVGSTSAWLLTANPQHISIAHGGVSRKRI